MERDAASAVDTLCSAIDRAGSPLCLGLDPDSSKMPDAFHAAGSEAEAAREFCLMAMEAAAEHVGVVKPQSACFERFGWPGVSALEDVCRRARDLGLFVLLDAKRGDIGVSARHYAAAAVAMGADAITANVYLGPETLEPYLDAGLMVFGLVRTSNPGSDAIQAAAIAPPGDAPQDHPRTVAQLIADQLASISADHFGVSGLTAVGAVVGATKSADAAALRQRLPDAMFLTPGVGAQGATADDLEPFLRTDRASIASAGLVVPVSRALLYPDANPGESPAAAIARTAATLKHDLAALL